MKNLGTGYAIGYIIAGLILIPLLIYGVNKLFFQGNDAEKYIHNYLINMEDITLKLDDNDKIVSGYDRYTAFLAKKRGGIIHVRTKTFYSTNYKKYFQFRMANVGDIFYTAFYEHIKKKSIILTVNKDDMKNPAMGTKEHPIPVFRVVGDEEPISIFHFDDNDKKVVENYDITQKQYENSVYVHLKYVMSKEEFKKRFEEK
ncbi:MAG: hypothetical protein LBE92_05540 [Chryseobacterium sp.]|jgi:hypothetical protein|uniref:hypothetical protein n=1 Tax=Chryseobacterium sp. TaxID=1871047 RepID=UPI00282CEC0F|nr:hypothetical protein [Chryseobacterium sp.]MDR2235565.1 hypothetical protein [Chryseobacterium sp.]